MEYSLPVLPTISTTFIMLSAIMVAIGWELIRKRKIEAHKKVMIVAAIFAIVFFIIYTSRTIFIGNTSFGGPDHIKIYYTIFLVFHITLATMGAILGIIHLLLVLKILYQNIESLVPSQVLFGFSLESLDLVVYLLLYVFYPGGDTTSVFKAILGF